MLLKCGTIATIGLWLGHILMSVHVKSGSILESLANML
jgi:hypothetical protein